jgi:formate C-acetyltransferase
MDATAKAGRGESAGSGPSERIRRLKEHIRSLNDAGVRRTTFFTTVVESLKETEGAPRPIRRAKSFAHLLETAELVVLPYELLAGSILGTWPLAEGLPSPEERRQEAIGVLEDYLARKESGELPPSYTRNRRHAMYARVHYHGNIDYGELQELNAQMQERFACRDISLAEIGRELLRHFSFDYGEETRRLFDGLPWVAANHLDLNYGRLVRRGFGEILDEMNARLSAARGRRQRTFYQSTRIAVEAAIGFIQRYADAVQAEARKPGTPPARAGELREMAEVCRRVARGRPENFREAIQLVWLAHTIGNMAGGTAMSFARFDQYMGPIYERSLAEGTTTRAEARDLLSCLWLKVNEPHMRTVQSLCLAGTTRDGRDATNELTALCLDVCADLKMPYPNTSVRLSRHSPGWLASQVVETMKLGFGQPMVLNDEAWVPNLHRVGFPLEDARDYYNMGCVEIMIMGRQPSGAAVHVPGWDWSKARRRAQEMENSRAAGPSMDFPQLIELVLNDGARNTAGETGVRTGDPTSFETFDEFLDACCRQITERIRRAPALAWRQDRDAEGRHYDPFGSALLEGCLESGRDMFQGGCALPPMRRIGGFGLGTAVDSLAAIKKFVFEEEMLDLAELRDVLAADFEGHEDLQRMLNRETPCYGNDLDEVDGIAQKVFGTYADAVHGQNDGAVPGPFVTSVFSFTRHVNMGEVTGATPNGRPARQAFSETVGPSQGKDVNGPTALIKSVAKLDHSRMTGACAMNIKFTPGLLRGTAGSHALKALLKTYLSLGGAQMQVNMVDEEVLRDAQVNPEKHRDLVVRVAGYCELFTSLDRAVQDEVIARTSHSAL